MGYEITTVLVFLLFGLAFVFFTVAVLGRLLRPNVQDPTETGKMETYECGEPTVGPSWVRFDIRFYTVALIFLIFDVEVTFLFPWAVVFKEFREAGFGLFLFAEVFLFLVILGVGFIYCWRKGDLDWVKSTSGRAVSLEEGTTGAESPGDRAEAEQLVRSSSGQVAQS